MIRVTAFSRRKAKAAGSPQGLCTPQAWGPPLRGKAEHFERELAAFGKELRPRRTGATGALGANRSVQGL